MDFLIKVVCTEQIMVNPQPGKVKASECNEHEMQIISCLVSLSMLILYVFLIKLDLIII